MARKNTIAQTEIQAEPGGSRSSARESSTALRNAAPKVTTRFKKGGDIDPMVYQFMPFVPALITNPEQRMLAAFLAVAEARKTGSTGRTPEGAARALLDKLAEVMGAQDGFTVEMMRERVERELGDVPVGAGVGLVVEDMKRTVPHLQEVDVAGNVPRLVARVGTIRFQGLARKQGDPVRILDAGNVGLVEPDGHLHRNCRGVVGEGIDSRANAAKSCGHVRSGSSVRAADALLRFCRASTAIAREGWQRLRMAAIARQG